ncbi:MAG: hypothetical protein H8D23_32695 [Candidatus Brocadiales bacterium]|nr:hypothetical protein [Candidatus Brocadiales bacterium]
MKADKTELSKSHHLVITTVTTGMTASTPYYFGYDTVGNGFPDLIPGAYPVLETWDTDVDDVDYYDNGVVITPKNPAPAAGDVLLDTYISRSEPQKTLTVDFS